MTTNMISPDQAIELLRKIVAETGPDYVLEGDDCYYFVSESGSSRRSLRGLSVGPTCWRPSCLVGHVLYRAGWTYKDLRNVSDNADLINVPENSETIDPLGIKLGLSEDTIKILNEAQIIQDGRDGHCDRSWGQALAAAETAYAPIGRARAIAISRARPIVFRKDS